MKIIKLLPVVVVSLISCICSANAQEFPNKLPDSDYDIQTGVNGFIRRINSSTGDYDIKMYSIQEHAVGSWTDIFRITTSGIMTINTARSYATPRLQLAVNNSIKGMIGLNIYNNNNMHFSSQADIEFYPNGLSYVNTSPLLKIGQSSTKVRSRLSLCTDNYSAEVMRLYLGRNNNPTISATESSWLRIGSNGGIALWGDNNVEQNDNPHVRILTDGKMQVGTISAASSGSYGSKLFVENGIVAGKNNGVFAFIGADDAGTSGWLGTKSNHGTYIGANSGAAIYVDPTNKNTFVGIAKSEADSIQTTLKNKYKMFVAKGILSEDYAIAPKDSWSDYVLEDDYQLKSIKEVETFISTNKHLPDVPSASDVKSEGYSQHEMNRILLQKIEELTLYIIQQDKEINTLKSKLNDSCK